MEDIKKKLEELKKEVYYAKHADLSIIDKIDVKVKELDKLIKNHGEIASVSDYPTEIVVLAKANYLNKEGAIVKAGIATIDGEEYYVANKADLYCR
jgi:hypothetical protein